MRLWEHVYIGVLRHFHWNINLFSKANSGTSLRVSGLHQSGSEHRLALRKFTFLWLNSWSGAVPVLTFSSRSVRPSVCLSLLDRDEELSLLFIFNRYIILHFFHVYAFSWYLNNILTGFVGFLFIDTLTLMFSILIGQMVLRRFNV